MLLRFLYIHVRKEKPVPIYTSHSMHTLITYGVRHKLFYKILDVLEHSTINIFRIGNHSHNLFIHLKFQSASMESENNHLSQF